MEKWIPKHFGKLQKIQSTDGHPLKAKDTTNKLIFNMRIQFLLVLFCRTSGKMFVGMTRNVWSSQSNFLSWIGGARVGVVQVFPN
jgi:hypothetical protein